MLNLRNPKLYPVSFPDHQFTVEVVAGNMYLLTG